MGGNTVQKKKAVLLVGGFGIRLVWAFLEQPVHPTKLAVHKSPWVIHQGLQNNRAVRPNYM